MSSGYAGFRQAGVAPARHRGLPSPSLTFILTLDDPLVVAAHSDPRQPPREYSTLLGGLHTTPALITFRFTAARGRIADAVVHSGGGITGAGLSLADLAAECGYYDQAHLARDFRALAGCPPTQWVAEEFRNIQASVADLRE